MASPPAMTHPAERDNPSPSAKALDALFSDTVDLTETYRALYVGVAGDITAILQEDSVAVLFKAVPVGVLPIKVSRIKVTGTTATNVVGLR